VPGVARGREVAPPAASSELDECDLLPQKYPGRAGVAMRDAAGSDAVAATPPDAATAGAGEGVPTEPQAPWGQAASPGQDGSDARARDEAGPGAQGGPPTVVIRRPDVPAHGMGGPSGPVLLDIDRDLRREANARIAAQQSAELLAFAMENYFQEAGEALASAELLARHAKFVGELERAAHELSTQEGRAYTEALATAVRMGLGLLDEVSAQAEGVEGAALRAFAELGLAGEAAKRAVADLDGLRTRQRRLRARARVLGNMDPATLYRRALEASHRGERESHRATRRALMRKRGGVFMVRQYAKVIAASERAFAMERKAAHYQAQADRTRQGTAAWARAQANADYYASLGEHERHRASVARSYVISRELARDKDLRGFLERRQAQQDAIDRIDRQLVELERFRSTYEGQVDAIETRLKTLAETDEKGRLEADRKGRYRAKQPSDQGKVLDLQRKQERLLRKLKKRLGGHGRTKGGGRTWDRINDLRRQRKAVASGGQAAPNPFAGTSAGHVVDYLREKKAQGPSDSVLSHLRAQLKSVLDEVIVGASARLDAAFDAAMAVGLAQYDPSLTPEQRAAAAESYADAVAAAEKEHADIENAMRIKDDEGVYDDPATGAEEFNEDMKKLGAAWRKLNALRDVCNNHPACADEAAECAAKSNDKQKCKLGPPKSVRTSVAGGGGTAISPHATADPSAPDVVSPSAITESGGKDEPPEREKKQLPEFQRPDFRELVRSFTEPFESFGRTVQMLAEEASEELSVTYQAMAKEAKKQAAERKRAMAEKGKELDRRDKLLRGKWAAVMIRLHRAQVMAELLQANDDDLNINANLAASDAGDVLLWIYRAKGIPYAGDRASKLDDLNAREKALDEIARKLSLIQLQVAVTEVIQDAAIALAELPRLKTSTRGHADRVLRWVKELAVTSKLFDKAYEDKAAEVEPEPAGRAMGGKATIGLVLFDNSKRRAHGAREPDYYAVKYTWTDGDKVHDHEELGPRDPFENYVTWVAQNIGVQAEFARQADRMNQFLLKLAVGAVTAFDVATTGGALRTGLGAIRYGIQRAMKEAGEEITGAAFEAALRKRMVSEVAKLVAKRAVGVGDRWAQVSGLISAADTVFSNLDDMDPLTLAGMAGLSYLVNTFAAPTERAAQPTERAREAMLRRARVERAASLKAGLPRGARGPVVDAEATITTRMIQRDALRKAQQAWYEDLAEMAVRVVREQGTDWRDPVRVSEFVETLDWGERAFHEYAAESTFEFIKDVAVAETAGRFVFRWPDIGVMGGEWMSSDRISFGTVSSPVSYGDPTIRTLNKQRLMNALLTGIGKVGERVFGDVDIVPPRMPRHVIERAYQQALAMHPPDSLPSADWVEPQD
jgi:hypothetical protein